MKIRIFVGIIALFFTGVIGLFLYSGYDYYKTIHSDQVIEPSLFVDEGLATIIRGEVAIDLEQGETYGLKLNDAVETRETSRATITWPDRSITRLGARTRIKITQMIVSQNYDHIQIAMEMKYGKIWTNVVRGMLGDSYFETHLPKNGIVAAVRGTVYEINLDHGYIHAVEHSMDLQDSSKKMLSLLPDEIVSSENIWMTRGKEILDTNWIKLNTGLDTTFRFSREKLQELRLEKLAGTTSNWIDTFIRNILKHFEVFRDLRIYESVVSKSNEVFDSLPSDEVIRIYQQMQGGILVKERDQLRSILIERFGKDPDIFSKQMFESLQSTAIWDMIEHTNISLPGAAEILELSKNNLTEGVQSMSDLLKNPPNTDQFKEGLRKWLVQ